MHHHQGLFDAEQAGAYLGMSAKSFIRLVEAGEIASPVYPFEALQRNGKRLGDPRWLLEDLDEFREKLRRRRELATTGAAALLRAS